MVCKFWKGVLMKNEKVVRTVPHACDDRRLLLKNRMREAAFLCLFLFTIGQAQALELQWSEDKFNHISEEQPIEELLRELFASQKLMVSISEKVSGIHVSGRFNDSYKIVFEKLSSVYDLTWYFDGQVMHVFRSNEVTSKLLPLKHLSPSKFEATLDKMGLINPRFPLRIYPDENIVVASGPHPYVAAIQDAMSVIDLESFTDDSQNVGVPTITRIFYLKNAWADDKVLFIDSNKVVIQGVASILRELVGTQKPQRIRINGENDFNEAEQTTRIEPLNAMAEDQPGGTGDIKRSIERDIAKLARTGRRASTSRGDTAVLNPDVTIQTAIRLNAIIIKDNLMNMPLYQKIIKELDVPLRLIEIKATIIDIAHDALKRRELGSAGKQLR
jgi:type III secretion protein C